MTSIRHRPYVIEEENPHHEVDAVALAEIYNKDLDTENVSHSSSTSSDGEMTTTLTTPAAYESTAKPPMKYSVAELVRTLGNDSRTATENLSPELERRVLDFRLAQQKRRDKYGVPKPWGVFGMYEHLAYVRVDLEWAEDAAWRRQHGEPYLTWTDFDDARLKSIRRPWFTYGIILVCTIMLIVEFAVNGWKIEPMSVNPMAGPSRDTLIKVGARDSQLIVVANQWFRLFTPLVLHAGIIHYVINMLAVWFIGAAVEQCHGMVNTVAMFVIPGVGGNILSAIFLPQYISVGASGGIFGLTGGCIADIGLNWHLLFIKNGDETDKQVWRRNFLAVTCLVVEIVTNIVSRGVSGNLVMIMMTMLWFSILTSSQFFFPADAWISNSFY